MAGFKACSVCLKPDAQAQSIFHYTKQGEKVQSAGSYYYENASGNRFFVFAFDMYYNKDVSFRSYSRGRQIISAVQYLSGKRLPASIENCPDLYMMCKRGDDESLTVGLWNIFADPVFEPVITLDQSYNSIRFIGCTGKLEGDKVYLSEISAFGFAGFEVLREEV